MKAEDDPRAARKLARSVPPLHDVLCFHYQQSAEKYLKALMQEAGLTIPKTHALLSLLGMLRTLHPELMALRRGLLFLSNFGVEIRYPSKRATKRQAHSALVWENRVRTMARVILKIWPKKKRKR